MEPLGGRSISMKILLIAGYGRSGSTLLEILLSKTLNAGAVGELNTSGKGGS